MFTLKKLAKRKTRQEFHSTAFTVCLYERCLFAVPEVPLEDGLAAARERLEKVEVATCNLLRAIWEVARSAGTGN